jgi:mannose-6-phosphate isomerase-like protein (cupin superfamily)
MKLTFSGRKISQHTGTTLRISLLLLLLAPGLVAQERKIDPTWLHRYLPEIKASSSPLTTDSCRYKPLFGEGDPEGRILRSVSRFGEAEVAKHGHCEGISYEREEEIYFVESGRGTLHYGDESHPLRQGDFTYLPPGVKHSILSDSNEDLRVLVIGFRLPAKIALGPSSAHPKIVNLDDVKEETVDGHPSSVLYKLLIGSRGAKRDAIDDAYVVTSFFWMDFAPGGTNFPHHHETAEEIYILIEGNGEIVAGSGMDGIEGRFPVKPGDAYYFRPNCTVGFYNSKKLGAKAYILAVRSRIPLPDDVD